jgi:hypothetical protein
LRWRLVVQRLFRVFILASLVVCISPLLAISQGIQQTPYSAADVVRRSGPSVVPDLTPSNPLGFPGSSLLGPRGSENISISSGMFQGILPKIPNLQLGYNYTFGPQLKAGTASVDYLLPFKLGTDSTIYGEAHGEFQTLSITQPGSPNNSTELCFGGGYRRMLGKVTMFGLHSIFNTAKLSGTWYPSASAGVEFASMISGHDAIDFIFNWYGKALDATIFGTTPAYAASAATATFGNANFDFQVGYSHELYNGGPDLRLSATGYKLECGSNVYGYYGGAELKSRDGVYVVKYDVGYDNAFDVYQSVAAFVNMGLQLENLLDGKSPFVKPKPVFQSPRNMTTLTEAKPNRNWRHTTQAATLTYLSAKAYPNCPYLATQCAEQTITVINNGTSTINALYMGFLPAANCPDPPYLDQASTYFPNWTPTTGNPNILQYNAPLATNGQVVITFPAMNRILVSISISANVLPWSQTCNVNQAEFTLGGKWAINPTAPLQDTYDISLNDGFNFPMEIKPDSGTPAMVCCSTGNSTAPGVYPLGASTCTAWDGTAANCPGPATEVHGTDAQGAPSPPCQYGVSPTNYTVYIGGIPPDVLSQSPTPTYCPNNGTTTTCTPGP